jgi:hypothetical protein
MSAIQALHDIEIGGGLAWPEEGKILVYLGSPFDDAARRDERGRALVGSFAEVEAWLRTRAAEHGVHLEPSTAIRSPTIVDRLLAAGVPGSVYWIFDGAFSVTVGRHGEGVSSWAEAEAWLEEHEDRTGNVVAFPSGGPREQKLE